MSTENVGKVAAKPPIEKKNGNFDFPRGPLIE
jgi:hypothetical protein